MTLMSLKAASALPPAGAFCANAVVAAKAIASTQAAEIISIRMGFVYIWTFLSFQNSIRVFQFGQNASSAFDPVFRIGTALDKTQEIAQFACGASPVALRSQRVAQIVVSQCETRVDAERFPIFQNRFFYSSLIFEGCAEIVVEDGIIGIDPQRLVVFDDRFVELALLSQCNPKIVVGLGVVGVDA